MNSANKINILLVDDRPENLLALEAIIEKEEYNLIKAYSGEEALKYLLQYDFAAILLDVQMPGMDGFGTAKIIKAREKTKNIPILFITANHLDAEHVFTGYSIGAIDYILKPFDPIILKAKVDGFVDLYQLNQTLIKQTEILADKKRELEKANLELSTTTSELRVSEALANVISETSIDSMIIIDDVGLILKVNPAVRDMFDYEEREIVGKNISVLLSCEASRKYINNVLGTINNLDHIVGYENLKEISATRKDGKMFPVEIQIGKRFVQGKCIVACTIRDITKKKQYEDQITHMAYHDGLTNLPNRRLFNERINAALNQAKQTNQSFAIMYLDMDRFKYINDSLGHIIGDKVLQEIAKRLKASVREGDFVARIGGDEFNVILPETNRENALEVAENILELFKQPFYIDNYELFITLCTGISIFPYDGEESLVLMKNADAALYRAKEQGQNQYRVFHSGMNIQSFRTFIMKNDLRKAIEREEFILVYQPRIEIETGIIRSVEALLRWNHPTWGTISPSEFIPLAEETGQIIEIGQWVLRSICNQSKAWQEVGLAPIRIAVNYSAQQFLQKDITDHIHQIISETGVDSNLLEIEITESVIMGNEPIITQTLNQLRKMGISITIDDFGIGYSSLNYLRRFPVDILKIDKSFVQDISSESVDSTALIATIVSLAHSLKMSVIAEGVETKSQLNMLRDHHCKEIQGYLFSPPVSPEEFKVLLLNHQYEQFSSGDHKGPYIESNTSNNLNDEQEIGQEFLPVALNRIKEKYAISTREMDVFTLIVNGLSNKKISEQLYISEHTVKNHITRIFQKLAVHDRLQAMQIVYQFCIEESKNLSLSNKKSY
jgi:diguanylate cyclase (GGDEF)-like protein/PAS domain S-box-containing protein